MEEFVYQGDGRTSVYVIVTVYKDTLLASYGVIESVDGEVHILHQEGVDEVRQLWTEKSFRCRFCRYATPQ